MENANTEKTCGFDGGFERYVVLLYVLGCIRLEVSSRRKRWRAIRDKGIDYLFLAQGRVNY
jgi:hypothetical protein